MRKTTRLAVLALMGAAALAAGCGSKKAKTPKEAAVNFAKAVEEGDKNLFMATIDAADKEAAEAMFSFRSAMAEFARKFEKQYGEGKLGVLQKQVTCSADEMADKVKIEERKAGKFAVLPDGAALPVVEKEGAWKLDISDLAKDAKGFQDKTVAVEKAVKKIGQSEYKDKPEKIATELAADIGLGGLAEKIRDIIP